MLRAGRLKTVGDKISQSGPGWPRALPTVQLGEVLILGFSSLIVLGLSIKKARVNCWVEGKGGTSRCQEEKAEARKGGGARGWDFSVMLGNKKHAAIV